MRLVVFASASENNDKVTLGLQRSCGIQTPEPILEITTTSTRTKTLTKTTIMQHHAWNKRH